MKDVVRRLIAITELLGLVVGGVQVGRYTYAESKSEQIEYGLDEKKRCQTKWSGARGLVSTAETGSA